VDAWVQTTYPPYGWRLFAGLVLGRSLGRLRATILDALNAINEQSDVAKFSLMRDSDGDSPVRWKHLQVAHQFTPTA
jgi:hypothetical protein